MQFAGDFTETNVVTAASTGLCFFKTVVYDDNEVANKDVWVALSFFIGLFFVLGIFATILAVYYCRRSRRRQWVGQKGGRIAPAALIAAAVMGRVSEA